MKLWKLWTDECDYDQYDSMVIAAKSRKRALKICAEKIGDGDQWSGQRIVDWSITPIGTADDTISEGVIVYSFNAG